MLPLADMPTTASLDVHTERLEVARCLFRIVLRGFDCAVQRLVAARDYAAHEIG